MIRVVGAGFPRPPLSNATSIKFPKRGPHSTTAGRGNRAPTFPPLQGTHMGVPLQRGLKSWRSSLDVGEMTIEATLGELVKARRDIWIVPLAHFFELGQRKGDLIEIGLIDIVGVGSLYCLNIFFHLLQRRGDGLPIGILSLDIFHPKIRGQGHKLIHVSLKGQGKGFAIPGEEKNRQN
jgi:hypothetical protein